ncbi:MAG: helix-turn-helix domain-containing protein, partial [Culicoidibacterales bacterium]
MATLLRNKHYQKFTVVPNGYLMDTTLSLQAIGLLTKLYQLPNSWDINIKSLQTQFKNGRDAIAKALKELEKKGYIKRYQEK